MRRSFIYPSLLLFFAFIISSWTLLTMSFPKGHDWLFELVRVSEFKSALLNGQLPPYWAENQYAGYGSPIFLFYAPLYSVLSTCCSFFTGSIISGCRWAIIFFSLVGILSTKFMVEAALGDKTFENQASSRMAAYFFILNPYLISDKLLRNANAEFAALTLCPLVIWGLITLLRKPHLGALILSMSLALVITAHNLTALVIFAVISMAAFILYLPGQNLRLWIYIVASVFLSVGLSAFFWVPAIYYKSLVRIEQMTTGKFDFHTNFPPLTSLFNHDNVFSIGPITPLALLWAAVIVAEACKNKNLANIKLTLFAFFSCIFLLFLQTRYSTFIWETIPYMPLFQFPWRMMGAVSVITSLLLGICFAQRFSKIFNRKIIIIAEIMWLAICTLNALPNLNAAEALSEKKFVQTSKLLTPEQIKENRLTATVGDEYLPRNADPRAYLNTRLKDGPIVQSIPEVEVKILKNTGTLIELETQGNLSANLEIARWFFPDWICIVNGQLHPIKKNTLGSFDISIPSGTNLISLKLMPPLLRRVLCWVSLGSLTLWCIFCILLCATATNRPRKQLRA